jgi:large subunit ribosomal protein L30
MIKKTAASATDSKAGSGDKATLTVKLVRSINGTRESHRATVRGLGLRKLNSQSTLEDTPAVRGMINKVSYLVTVL